MKEKNKRKIPPITQNDDAESGAAALCMILASYGRYVDLSEMRKACHVSRDGCRIDNLIAAAESYGMKADAVRCEASLEGIKLPVIARWKQDHWLVVEERTEKGIRLVDPAYGKRRVSEEEFAESFSFQVISLEPTSEFVKGGKPYKLTDSIREMMQGSRGVFLYLTLLCFLLNMVGLMLPGMTRLFVDFYLPSLSSVKVGRYFLVFLMLLALFIHRSSMLPSVMALTSLFYLKDTKVALRFWYASIVLSLFAGPAFEHFFASLGFDDRMSAYTAEGSSDGLLYSGFRFDFLFYSAFPVWMIWYVTQRRKFNNPEYSVYANTYLLCNAFWILVIRASFSNRFAYLSWFLYPLVIAYPLMRMNLWKDQDRKTAIIFFFYTGFTFFMFFVYYFGTTGFRGFDQYWWRN